MIYASILAAGIGVRMHRQDMPKQFLQLGDKPIIIHTLEQFFLNPLIERIVIVAPDHWIPYTEDLMVKYNLTDKEFAVISGGANKAISINLAAEYINKTWGITKDDIIVAHDAIRPFITQRIIDENIQAVQKHGAAVTAIRTIDTILVSKDGKLLDEMPPHLQMYAEQTPQSYPIMKLLSVIDKATTNNISLKLENELPRLWINMGEHMSIVDGEYFNMKIINPYDLEVANSLLKERSS